MKDVVISWRYTLWLCTLGQSFVCCSTAVPKIWTKMRSSSIITALIASVAPVVIGVRPPVPVAPKLHVVEAGASSATVGYSTFQQYLDHDHPELGTFSQRYWYSDQYWSGPGAPVRFPPCIAGLFLSVHQGPLTDIPSCRLFCLLQAKQRRTNTRGI